MREKKNDTTKGSLKILQCIRGGKFIVYKSIASVTDASETVQNSDSYPDLDVLTYTS